MRWLYLLLLSIICVQPIAGQTPASAQAAQVAAQSPVPGTKQDAPELSPQAAYDQAARSLDSVRRPVQNWSDAEIAALKVAMGQANTACLARNPDQYTGEDLLAYAQLCAFAHVWEPVQKAATNYLIAQSAASPEEKLTGFPGLSLAFDFEVMASLQLKNPDRAFGTTQTMLRTVPYDDMASEASNATIRYVQLIHTDQALTLLTQRQPILLAMLKTHATTVTTPGAHPPHTIHDLYSDAIALPAMQQFANQPDQAAASFAELEAALPANLSPDDAIFTAASRRQYRLLGAPLPAIAASASLLSAPFAAPQDLNVGFSAARIFVLFPDWCAQCVSMNPQFVSAMGVLNQKGVRFYALLAQANPRPPAVKDAPKLPVKAGLPTVAKSGKTPGAPGTTAEVPHVELQLSVKPTPAELLVGTPTLIVPPETLTTFVATDFPLLIATDHQGIVRYIQPAPENALVSGGIVEQIADRIVEQWPPFKHDSGAGSAEPPQ